MHVAVRRQNAQALTVDASKKFFTKNKKTLVK